MMANKYLEATLFENNSKSTIQKKLKATSQASYAITHGEGEITTSLMTDNQ